MVTNNTSILLINYKEDLDKTSFIWDLETIKYTTQNIKLNKANKEVFTLFDSNNEAYLIF